eukprot:TRINITY_DN96110_c0_g1_i1.p1 TRINITY_DN96110_c0_g1~~TRINITY_DN96110_c0_g1_i1.p1  ORF type:complete len:273 (+),score=56.65 TRINITY_DN96110_c0_g1_i1:57-875(+)
MEARRAELDSACKLFMKNLTGPGDFLTGARRASIAQEAARAAECTECSKVRQEGKKAGLLKRVESLNHNYSGPSGIGCLVLCVANLQELLDAEWYDAAVEKLAMELTSLGEFHGGHDERVACLTELVMVVAGIVGVRNFYSSSGMQIPPLPATTEGAPLFQHVSEFCAGKLERTGYAWGFQVMKSKVLATGLAKIGQSPAEWTDNTNPMSPYSKMTPTPLSMSHQHAWMQVMYIPSPDVINLSAEVPQGRCLDRPNMELVAGTYSGAVHCSF